jgi:hypothetical protein
MVTLAGTQNFNEFELHLRAILSLPIAEITLEKAGASAVILAQRIRPTQLTPGSSDCGFAKQIFASSGNRAQDLTAEWVLLWSVTLWIHQ